MHLGWTWAFNSDLLCLYPTSRGSNFAVWGVMRKVASTNHRSTFYRASAKFVTRFASKFNRRLNGASFARIKNIATTLICYARLTLDSRNALNRSRTGKNRGFFNLFLQISGRIWTVVGRGYFSHDSSHNKKQIQKNNNNNNNKNELQSSRHRFETQVNTVKEKFWRNCLQVSRKRRKEAALVTGKMPKLGNNYGTPLSPRATLTHLSCSPNFPRASITR